MEDRRVQIISAYLTYVKSNKEFPTNFDLEGSGITKGMLRHHFGSLQKLKDVLVKAKPKFFKCIKQKSKQEELDVAINRAFGKVK